MNVVKKARTPNSDRPRGARNQVLSANAKRRREEAEVRQVAAAKRTPEQQLERLDKLFGPGQGAKKERAKLVVRIQARQAAELAAATATVVSKPQQQKSTKQQRRNT